MTETKREKQPTTSSFLSVIIPAHNESNRIVGTLQEYLTQFSTDYGEQFEIIVVSNNCADDTYHRAMEIAVYTTNVRVININENIGKGGAIKEGLRHARGDIFLFVDADGATPAVEARSLIEAVSDGCYHVAIGSRNLSQSHIIVKQPFSRRVMGRMFRFLVCLLFNIWYKDTQCGAKAFRRESAEIILSRVRTDGFTFDVDFLWHMKKTGYRVIELPIVWTNKNGSTLCIHRHVPSMFWQIIKLRFKHG